MEKRASRQQLRKAGATLAIATGLVTGAMGGTAFADHNGGNSDCSNAYGSCHSNAVASGDVTVHILSSRGTDHFFFTSGNGGRTDRPQ